MSNSMKAWLNNPFILQTATKYSTNMLLNVAEKISNRFPAIETALHKGLTSIEEKLTEYNASQKPRMTEDRNAKLN